MYDASLFHDMTIKGFGFHKMIATQKKNQKQSTKLENKTKKTPECVHEFNLHQMHIEFSHRQVGHICNANREPN